MVMCLLYFGYLAGSFVYMLSRDFLIQLSVSSLIALPFTYLFFATVVLTRFPYHTPVQVAELFVGLLAALVIAFLLIGSQTMKATKTNPVDVLKSE